jgi:nicotinate-nucleotide adenylyltransferase
MTSARRLGVFGGTFDPIHVGHLDLAEAAWSTLALDELRFVPLRDPPHRVADPRATAFHRFALVSLAIDGHRGYRACDLELARQGPSYTADTLRALRVEGWIPSQIFLLLGADAFAEISTWREFPDVLESAHFAIVGRPGMTPEDALSRTPQLGARVRQHPDEADTRGGTSIFFVTARTRDVSSSAIRARLAARESVAELVPAAVERHILAHHLYGAVGDLHGDT